MIANSGIPSEKARQRITRAAGRLIVWAVLEEDNYETLFGDGFYLHLAGVTLNEADARRLAELVAPEPWIRWHIRRYDVGLGENGEAVFLAPLKPEEEFKIRDLVALLDEIAPGATASRLYTGRGYGKSCPFVSLPEE
jgi:hypothetical protein